LPVSLLAAFFCIYERQLRQTFYKFHCFGTRRHLALLFAIFLVKSASHQQTLLQNAANSGLRFGNHFFIFIISVSGCISSHFLQLFLKALLIVLSGYVANTGKQRCVRQLCIICKRLITLSQIRQLHKKKTVVPGRGLQPTTTPDRQQRYFF